LSEATGKKPDKSWTVANVWAASIAEANVGIMCACAPSLKSVFGKFFRDLTSKSNSKESSANKSQSGGKEYSGGSSDKMGMYFDSRITDVTTTTDMDKTTRSDSAASWISKIPFAAKRKSDTMAGQELTSFAAAHKYGVDSYSNVVEGYDDEPNTRLSSPASMGDEVPLRPTVFRYDFAHEDLIMTNPTSPPPQYADMRSTDPAIPLPAKVAGGPGMLSPKKTNDQERSNTPSFIFIDNQDGQETLRRVRYHSYISSTDSQGDHSPVNTTAQRSQSLQDSALMAPVRENVSQRAQIHSVPSKVANFDSFKFPSPKQPEEEKKPAASASATPQRGSVRNALLNLKNQTKRAESPAQLSPTSLGFPQTSNMPNFHRNNISHISDPSESESSGSSIHEFAVDDRDEKKESQRGVTKAPAKAPVALNPRGYPAKTRPVSPPALVTPRGYPATARPVSPPEKLKPREYPATQPAEAKAATKEVFSPGGYPATRPARGSSIPKPAMNLSSNATRQYTNRPSTSSAALSSPTYGNRSSSAQDAVPFKFNETPALDQPESQLSSPSGPISPHIRADSTPAIGVAVPWTPDRDVELGDFPSPKGSDGIQRPRVRRVKSREKKW
jgi:hypothetical protein